MFSVRAQRPDNILANYKTRFPAFESTLDLDFINNRSVVNGVAGSALALVTFTRSTTGTYFGSDGLLKTAAINEPRFDYDSVSLRPLGPLGLLIEESRANIAFYSADFRDTASAGSSRPWSNDSGTVVTPNSIIAPDGTLTGQLITSTAEVGVRQSQVITNQTVTESLYVKAGSAPLLRLRDDNNGTSVVFSPATGVISSQSNVSAASCLPVGNGWFRITATYTTTTASWALNIRPTSTGTFYAWGAQLEAGGFATSYIPTTSASVTRGADVASMTGTNFSSWYNQGEGSVIIDFDSVGSLSSSGGRLPLSISDATFNNSIYLSASSASDGNSSVVYVFSGGVQQAAIPMGAYANYARRISAIGLQNNNITATSDGGYAVVDSSCTLPVVDRMYIGSASWNLGSTNSVSGHIGRLTYYPKRLPNNLLQHLSRPTS